MRVICPATPDGLQPTTVPALLRSGYPVEVVPMLRTYDYHKLLVEVWARQETVVIVEHDIEVNPAMIAGLFACPHEWCAHSYWVYLGSLMDIYNGNAGLGCTKIAGSLMAETPDLIMRLLDFKSDDWVPGTYGMLDSAMAHWLKHLEFGARTCHRHLPDVKHHHPYDYVGAHDPTGQIAKAAEEYKDYLVRLG